MNINSKLTFSDGGILSLFVPTSFKPFYYPITHNSLKYIVIIIIENQRTPEPGHYNTTSKYVINEYKEKASFLSGHIGKKVSSNPITMISIDENTALDLSTCKDKYFTLYAKEIVKAVFADYECQLVQKHSERNMYDVAKQWDGDIDK